MYRLYGGYENLDAGLTVDALIDMSGNLHYIWTILFSELKYVWNKGGLEESFELEKLPAIEKNRLWSIMYQAYSKNAIMGCSITVIF